MSKKSKKTADNASPEQVEGQEVSNSEEHVPPTIVEAGEEEVFPSQAEEQSDPKNAGQTTEKPAAKPKTSKRPYIDFVRECLENGTYSRPELIAAVLEKFPTVSKGGISTFATDLRNVKYSHFRDRKVVLFQGKLIFEDRISTEIEGPGPEVVPEAEPTEKPAE